MSVSAWILPCAKIGDQREKAVFETVCQEAFDINIQIVPVAVKDKV